MKEFTAYYDLYNKYKNDYKIEEILSGEYSDRAVEKAKAANEAANPDIHTFVGRVASGDQFIASSEAKDRIADTFHALCTEMEGAGIAQAAYLNRVSYVIIRAISDKADNSAFMDYPEFERRAIERSVRLVKELMAKL